MNDNLSNANVSQSCINAILNRKEREKEKDFSSRVTKVLAPGGGRCSAEAF